MELEWARERHIVSPKRGTAVHAQAQVSVLSDTGGQKRGDALNMRQIGISYEE